jgi:hypothetical protein
VLYWISKSAFTVTTVRTNRGNVAGISKIVGTIAASYIWALRPRRPHGAVPGRADGGAGRDRPDRRAELGHRRRGRLGGDCDRAARTGHRRRRSARRR